MSMIDFELLQRYDRPGPRYTSYPPVPIWQTTSGVQVYETALSKLAARPNEPLSLYVHLPFCVERCHYCGCNATVTRYAAVVDRYLDRIEREIALVTDRLQQRRQVVQMHWGGGTPNFLNEAQTRRLFMLLTDHFDFLPDAEISLEIDPRIGTLEQMELLRSIGFNRISFGVQDFDGDVQNAIGRIQSQELTEELFWHCRKLDFSSINLDLVYGLPWQTTMTFKRTLDAILAMQPDRVACFSYAHVPWSRPNQKLVDTSNMPSPHDKFGLFLQAINTLTAEGYDWIGMDHFALHEDELALAVRERRLHRNFMGYTVQPAAHLLAFGSSAIGDLVGCYVQNDAKLGGYQRTIDAGQLPIVRSHVLSDDDLVRRAAITHLMCNLELPYTIAGPTLEPAIERLRSYVDEGFVEAQSDRIVVTRLGRFFIRNLCMELDAYLPALSDRPVFSRTI